MFAVFALFAVKDSGDIPLFWWTFLYNLRGLYFEGESAPSLKRAPPLKRGTVVLIADSPGKVFRGMARWRRGSPVTALLPVDADLGKVDVDDLDSPGFSKVYLQKCPVGLTAMAAEVLVE